MAALAADKAIVQVTGRVEYLVKASTHIYKGAMVAVSTTDGYAVPASDTANLVVVGIAAHGVNNTGANGAAKVHVRRGRFEVNCDSAVQAMVGSTICVKDDQTLQTAAAATNDVVAGTVVKLVNASKVVVKIGDEEDL